MSGVAGRVLKTKLSGEGGGEVYLEGGGGGGGGVYLESYTREARSLTKEEESTIPRCPPYVPEVLKRGEPQESRRERFLFGQSLRLS